MSAVLDRTDVQRFRAIVGQRLGLQFEDGKLDYLAEVLRERMNGSGCPFFSAYESRFAERAAEREEVRALAGRLTVAETYFFRYWDHFRAFVDVVLPERVRATDGARPLRVLSAGCASGEEAYSLAILTREHLPAGEFAGVKVLGVDVNPAMVERAIRARYSMWSLRDTTLEMRARYFHAEGRDVRLDDGVRGLASFEERNLVDDDPLFWRPDSFDVVFCRNVMMYFTPEVMSALVARICRSLAPGGFLFLGHAETLRGVSQDFHLRHTHDTFYYQRRHASESSGPALSAPSVRPRARPVPSLATALDLSDSSWVDAIQKASERIEQLTRPSTMPPARAVTEAPPGRSRNAVDLQPAVDLLRQERFAEAMELLQALPTSSRGDPDAQLLRGALLTNSGRLGEAEQICTEILAADELSAGAHYLMALCREHAGDRGGALDHDQIATYLDAGFAMPHLHLGLLARRAGDQDGARAELGRALALLAREDGSRILLFGGGFSREALIELCRSELRASEGGS